MIFKTKSLKVLKYKWKNLWTDSSELVKKSVNNYAALKRTTEHTKLLETSVGGLRDNKENCNENSQKWTNEKIMNVTEANDQVSTNENITAVVNPKLRSFST